MGIFGRFFRKEKTASEKPEPSIQKIYYGNAAAWLDSELHEEIGRLSSRASALCDDVVAKAGKLKGKIIRLGSASFDPHDKTYAAVNMTKDTFVNKSVASLNTIRPCDAKDYGKLIAFKESVERALNSVKNATPKQALLISNYFKEQGADIVKGVREAEKALAQLSGFLEGEGLLLKKVMEAKESAALLARLDFECRTMQLELGRISGLLSSLEPSISSKKTELESFTQSEEWKAYSAALEKLSEIGKQMKGIEQEANNRLSVLRRPMKKLSHEKGTAALPDNPFSDILLGGGDVQNIIRMVDEAAEAGEIDLKPSERERIIALKDSADEITGLMDSYNRLMSQREETSKSTGSSVEETKGSMEAALSGLNDERQRLQREINDLENEIRRKYEERERQQEETRRAVQEAAGKEIDIIMQKDSGQAQPVR